MATVFLDQKGVLLMDVIFSYNHILSELWNTRLRSVIQNWWHGMLTSGIILLHNNACPYNAVHIAQKIKQFRWKRFEHPLYSPNPALSDFHCFLCFKKWLDYQRFNESEKLKAVVQNWLKSKAPDFYAQGIKNSGAMVRKMFGKTVTT